MAYYFKHFPIINYDMNKNNKTFVATNIIKRFRPLEDVLNKAVLFYNYTIKEGERPETVSYNVYGTIEYDWVILMFNKMIDPYFSWPLDYEQFKNFINKKYGSIQSATQTIHHYERILQNSEVLNDGTIVPERVLIVDKKTYSNLIASERRIIYNYDYELKLNENKRIIKIIDDSYLPKIKEEKERIFNG